MIEIYFFAENVLEELNFVGGIEREETAKEDVENYS